MYHKNDKCTTDTRRSDNSHSHFFKWFISKSAAYFLSLIAHTGFDAWHFIGLKAFKVARLYHFTRLFIDQNHDNSLF